tara:strand:+ start:2826 stop:3659 length:834 start_codon:yes stop_codon:yes gene_type:complete
MNGADLKIKIQNGEIIYGTMLSVSRNPRWVESIAKLGLDYLIIDTEHSPLGRSEVADLLAMFKLTAIVPIVRIPIPDSHYATMAIDAGSQGVLAPYCETVEQVEEIVSACKWRPLKGEFVNNIIKHQKFPSEETKLYLENKNKDNLCIIGIESVPAINNLDDILSIDGIDAIFVGPNDLTISLGIPDQYDHPEYKSAVKYIIDKSKSKGIPTLVHQQTVELTKEWIENGSTFVLYSSDSRMINPFVNEIDYIKSIGNQILGKNHQKIGDLEDLGDVI